MATGPKRRKNSALVLWQWALGMAVLVGLWGQPDFAIASSDEDSGFALSDSPYLDMDPMLIPILRDDEVRGQINIWMSLEITKGEEKIDIWRQTAKLRDGYFRSLNSYASNQLDYRKRLNTKLIKRLLQRVTDKVLGENVAEVVLGQAHILKQKKRRRRRR